MAEKLQQKDLLDAGAHFGHMTRKWDPHMAPYIFMERSGIHIIDLNKTQACLEQACAAVKNIVKSGRKVLFVGTKKQSKEVVAEEAQRLGMPYVTERWLGGMLTNFVTVRKSLKKMASLDKLMKDEAYQNMAKRERLSIQREREKLERLLGGISSLTRLPYALFVVDIKKEHIAVKEAQKLNIPVFAIVDTNSNPEQVDYPVPANDDAYKSIALVTREISKAVDEGLAERKAAKEQEEEEEQLAEKKKQDMGEATEEEATGKNEEAQAEQKEATQEQQESKGAEAKEETKANASSSKSKKSGSSSSSKSSSSKQKASATSKEDSEDKQDASSEEEASDKQSGGKAKSQTKKQQEEVSE